MPESKSRKGGRRQIDSETIYYYGIVDGEKAIAKALQDLGNKVKSEDLDCQVCKVPVAVITTVHEVDNEDARGTQTIQHRILMDTALPGAYYYDELINFAGIVKKKKEVKEV